MTNQSEQIAALTAELNELKLIHAFDHKVMIYNCTVIADLAKDRNEYARAADTMASAHKIERDSLMVAARKSLCVLNRIKQLSDQEWCLGWGLETEMNLAISDLKALVL